MSQSSPLDVAGLAARVAPSLVAVATRRHAASGFFWKGDLIVTATDPLDAKRGDAVRVLTANGEIEGHVLGRDPTTAIALLRVPTQTLPPAPLSTPLAAPALGAAVIALGRGQHGPTLAVGHVALSAGPWRSQRGGDLSHRLWLDLRLPRFAEGGLAIGADGPTPGLSLGMTVAGPRRRVVVIPADTIARVATELLAHGRIRRGYLGVRVQPVPVGDKTGLMIASLEPGGPAARAGLLQGDILVGVGAETPDSPRALARGLKGATIGQPLAIDIVRAGQPQRLDVTIGESPAT